MYAHEYGKQYFKHKTAFKDLVVFSDNQQGTPHEEPALPSQNTYIRAFENWQNTDLWFIDFDDILAGEYGDFYIEENPGSYKGQISSDDLRYYATPENDAIFQENIIDLQDGEVAYVEINGRYYIQLNSSIVLDEIVIKASVKKYSYKLGEFSTENLANRIASKLADYDYNIDYKTFISFFISDDGASLERAYQKIDKVNDNELILFIETNEGSNLFGTVFRLKVGKNVQTVIDENFQRLAKVARSFNVDVQSNELSRIIKQEVKDRDNLFYMIFREVAGTVIRVITWPVKEVIVPILGKISEGFEAISKGIDSLKFKENRWKATIDGKENPDYNPLLPGYNLIKSFSPEKIVKIANDYMFSPLLKKAKGAQELLNKYPKLKKFLNIDLSGLVAFLEAAPSTLGEILEAVKSVAKHIFQFINGIIVGLLNSIIDFVKSIFDLLKLIVDIAKAILNGAADFAKHPVSYMSMIAEVVENFIDIIVNTFTVKNFKELVSFIGYSIAKGIESIAVAGGDLATGKSLFPSGTIGYYTGYIVGFIISEVLTLIVTGGAANFAQGLSKFYASVKSMTSAAAGFAQRAGKTVTKIFSLENLLQLLKKLLEFSKNIPKLFKDLRKVMDGFVDDLKKTTKEALEKVYDNLFPKGTKDRKFIDDNNYKITGQSDNLIQICPI